MDKELRDMLQENLELSRENNKLLKKVRGVQKRTHLFRLAYWIIIIGITLGAYYYIQPYLEKIISMYNEGAGSILQLQNFGNSLPDVSHLQDLLKQVQAKQ
jgi:hypothetical protein